MIKAVGDKIIVSILRIEKTAGGLIIPTNSTSEPQSYGKVISIGETVKNIQLGNVVVFHPRSGMAMAISNKEYKCLKYEEIYGVLTDEVLAKQLGEVVIE